VFGMCEPVQLVMETSVSSMPTRPLSFAERRFNASLASKGSGYVA